MFQQIFLCCGNFCRELGYKCLPLFYRWGCHLPVFCSTNYNFCDGKFVVVLGVFLAKQLMTLDLKCLIFPFKSFFYLSVLLGLCNYLASSYFMDRQGNITSQHVPRPHILTFYSFFQLSYWVSVAAEAQGRMLYG